MAFTLPPLPFDKAALEPHLSAESFDYHHGKHHQAYIDKVNEAVEGKGLDDKSLVDVIRFAKDSGDKALANNGGQIWNHDFFWQCLAPEGSTKPSDKLNKLIDAAFGSQAELIKKLDTEADTHFASGWAWLVLAGDALKIMSVHDGETPLGQDGIKPLFTIDVWEHAYYIDYRNDRPKYTDMVLGKLINWDFVSRNIEGNAVAAGDQLPMAA